MQRLEARRYPLTGQDTARRHDTSDMTRQCEKGKTRDGPAMDGPDGQARLPSITCCVYGRIPRSLDLEEGYVGRRGFRVALFSRCPQSVLLVCMISSRHIVGVALDHQP